MNDIKEKFIDDSRDNVSECIEQISRENLKQKIANALAEKIIINKKEYELKNIFTSFDGCSPNTYKLIVTYRNERESIDNRIDISAEALEKLESDYV